jgi:predicted nuclease of predicted toxin-antitoxin system
MNLGQMRFLTDENISPKVAAYLREHGANVLDVKECGWQGMSDNEILEKALVEKRVCLTCDKDFGTLAVYGKKPYYGIIFVRPRNVKPTNIIKLLGKLIEKVEFEERMIITLTDANIRVRRHKAG